MLSAEEGTPATPDSSRTGVPSALLQNDQAERVYIVANGACASLRELISSNSLSMTPTERDGYSYAVECSGAGFSVAARHLPAPAGSPIRYPNLSIDSSMQVHEIE